MNRRGFLKLALGIAAAAVVPLKPKVAPLPIPAAAAKVLPVVEPPALRGLPCYIVRDWGYYPPQRRSNYGCDVMKVVDFKPGARQHVGCLIVEKLSPSLSSGDVLRVL
jgi:hypothetical protein